MAAQSAAIFAMHKCEKLHTQEAERQRETREFVKRVLKKYDHSSTGGLLFEELRSYLLDLHPERKGKGAKVKNAEVKWVIQVTPASCCCRSFSKLILMSLCPNTYVHADVRII